ncbi:GntR family transcriptional regulator [Amylibacter marinus]|uniref:GntR family transcriptional regulator n=1 Tax=Amylibacter marinus TaxID=1475483 RepID=A0ABQ5VXU8_9RHOB|nr:GntR family transcriptional regulator [Amylibacter marinus]
MIFSGELAAGTDHLEAELAARLGMSRTPVRDATLILASQGLLEVRPRKGVRILTLSADDMHEIYEVLTELESLSAASAARKNYGPKDLEMLAKTVTDMETALAEEDLQAWANADEAFHSELVRLGGNRRIASIVENFNDQVRRARAMTLKIRPMPHQSSKDHSALFQAIARGDATAAHQIHWQHRDSARQLITGLLEQLGLRHF